MQQSLVLQLQQRVQQGGNKMIKEDLIVLCEEIIDQLEGNKDLGIVLNNAYDIRASLINE
jgi:hypothetical protein